MKDAKTKQLAQRRFEDLIAVSLFRTRANKVKEYVKKLYRTKQKAY